MSAISLQRKMDKKYEQIAKLHTEIAVIRGSLQGICDHAVTRDYRWEHDNGYGRQTPHKGKYCYHCGWISFWNNGIFVDPRDISD